MVPSPKKKCGGSPAAISVTVSVGAAAAGGECCDRCGQVDFAGNHGYEALVLATKTAGPRKAALRGRRICKLKSMIRRVDRASDLQSGGGAAARG